MAVFCAQCTQLCCRRIQEEVELFDHIIKEFGRLDLLFNNAGVSAPGAPMDELTVDQRRVDRELAENMRKLGKFGGPVEPAAGDQPDLAMLDAGEQAIAVVFDFVQPFGAGRRRSRHRRELRLEADGHRAF